jgi:DNA-directed RNA polymerase subunit omega
MTVWNSREGESPKIEVMEGELIMLHPSYADLMQVLNSEVEPGEHPVVNSRYSVVLATAKRARQIISGAQPYAEAKCNKPLSVAVEEVYQGKVKIVGDEEEE